MELPRVRKYVHLETLHMQLKDCFSRLTSASQPSITVRAAEGFPCASRFLFTPYSLVFVFLTAVSCNCIFICMSLYL